MCSRECLATRVKQSIKGIDVVRLMEDVKQYHSVTSKKIQVDNDSEFICKDFDRWAYENQVTLDYLRPGNQRIIISLNRSTAASEMSA